MAKQSFLTPDMIAAFESKGGAVRKVAADATAGITHREWKRLVRGEEAPTEEDVVITHRAGRFHAGYGAR